MIEAAVEHVYGKTMAADDSQVDWNSLVPRVITRLRKVKDDWKYFNESFHTHKNPLYVVIYNATRNYSLRKRRNVKARAKKTSISKSQVVGTNQESGQCSKGEELEDTASFGPSIESIKSKRKQNPSTIGKKSKGPAKGSLDSSAAV